MDWLEKLVRPAVRDIKAYSSARNEAGGVKAGIFLDANELLWPPHGSDPALTINRYGDPQPQELLERLAAVYGVKAENLLVGRGSDEGIDLLVRAFCREGIDSVMICPPAFGMYKVSALTQGAPIISVPLNAAHGYQLDVPAMQAALKPDTKIIFLTSPHAPMGHALNRADILALCKATRGNAIVVVDEAYVEFTPDPRGLIPDMALHDNMVILRTMSKAHMLAGERIGSIIAHPALIKMVGKIMPAYPLPKTSVRAALDALSPAGLEFSAAKRALVVSERERIAKAFAGHPDVVKIYPSVANFIFMEVKPSSKAFMAKAAAAGILLRDRHSDLPNCVRFSLGRPEDNDALLKAFGLS